MWRKQQHKREPSETARPVMGRKSGVAVHVESRTRTVEKNLSAKSLSWNLIKYLIEKYQYFNQ